jgi:hypothetical protein
LLAFSIGVFHLFFSLIFIPQAPAALCRQNAAIPDLDIKSGKEFKIVSPIERQKEFCEFAEKNHKNSSVRKSKAKLASYLKLNIKKHLSY